jgi:2,3-bisphosphoglycerate-independent phosphoglycerate mutase
LKENPHIILLFLDGVGIGRQDPKENPFFNAKLPNLEKYLDGKIPSKKQNVFKGHNASFVRVNANLGMSGLPQSGTGQSALITGVNTAKFIGKHFGPYLYSTLKPVVEQKNIFVQLRNRGFKSCYANAFPQQYFDYISAHKRDAAISFAWRSINEPLKNADSLRNGNALSADITNERWNSLGYPDILPISIEKASHRLVRIAEKCNFVLFEYFYTDHAGHSQSMPQAVNVLEKIDSLIGHILEKIDKKRMLLLVISDHGNIENLSVKSHTRNPVPFISFGVQHERIVAKIKNITDVTPAIIEMFM